MRAPRPVPTLLLATIVLLTACSDAAPSTATASATGASATPRAGLAIQDPVAGLPYDDPRLAPVLAELRAHPEWLDEPLPEEPEILALVPGSSELCLALRGPGGDVHVTIRPAPPWSVAQVALDRGDPGREITYDPAARGDDICAYVVGGRAESWPDDAGPIVVQGSVAGPEARAIADAVFAAPERFAIDRQGIPAVNVGERIEPGPGDWTCSWGYVFVGGPRSRVVIGTRPVGGGWEVETRIVEAALVEPEPRRTGRC